MDPHEQLHDVRIAPAAIGFFLNGAQRFGRLEGRFVRTRIGERVVDIRDLQHPRHERDLFLTEAVRDSRSHPSVHDDAG